LEEGDSLVVIVVVVIIIIVVVVVVVVVVKLSVTLFRQQPSSIQCSISGPSENKP
jgi:hypothetical protein